MRPRRERVFLIAGMNLAHLHNGIGLRLLETLLLAAALAMAGCFADTWAYTKSGGMNGDTVVGEEQVVNYPADTALSATEDALRGEGILFEQQPDDEIVTFYRPANIPVGTFGAFFGVQPQYRYEIQVTPDNSNRNRSKIIINVRGEDIPPDQLPNFKASTRYDLFARIEKLAAAGPPSATTPRSGGVNFALLPGEDLKGLARRVTGSAANWSEIAKDNGIKSPTDVAPMQTIWVRNTLLKPVAAPAPGPTR